MPGYLPVLKLVSGAGVAGGSVAGVPDIEDQGEV